MARKICVFLRKPQGAYARTKRMTFRAYHYMLSLQDTSTHRWLNRSLKKSRLIQCRTLALRFHLGSQHDEHANTLKPTTHYLLFIYFHLSFLLFLFRETIIVTADDKYIHINYTLTILYYLHYSFIIFTYE